jgi:hypothetical protein
LNWTFSARLAVNCNVGLFVATGVPLLENVSQVFAIIGFGRYRLSAADHDPSKLADFLRIERSAMAAHQTL